jgi:hypothetical protein
MWAVQGKRIRVLQVATLPKPESQSFPPWRFLATSDSAGSMDQRDLVTGHSQGGTCLHDPGSRPTGCCPVQPNTPLGQDQVNVLLLLGMHLVDLDSALLRGPYLASSRTWLFPDKLVRPPNWVGPVIASETCMETHGDNLFGPGRLWYVAWRATMKGQWQTRLSAQDKCPPLLRPQEESKSGPC